MLTDVILLITSKKQELLNTNMKKVSPNNENPVFLQAFNCWIWTKNRSNNSSKYVLLCSPEAENHTGLERHEGE